MTTLALPHIPASVVREVSPPTVRIHTDADVEIWKHTVGYHMYGNFLRRLNGSVAGWDLPLRDTAMDSEVGIMQYS